MLSLVTGLFCHHRPQEASASQELDASVGASGPHDFTVRDMPPIHAQKRVTSQPRPPHPAPNVRDGHETPLLGARAGGIIQVIWDEVKINSENQNIFTGADEASAVTSSPSISSRY